MVSDRHDRMLPCATAAPMVVTQLKDSQGYTEPEVCPHWRRFRVPLPPMPDGHLRKNPATRFREQERRLVNDDRGRSFGRSRPSSWGAAQKGDRRSWRSTSSGALAVTLESGVEGTETWGSPTASLGESRTRPATPAPARRSQGPDQKSQR